MRKEFLTIDGEKKMVLMERVQDTLWIHYEGETFSLENEKRRSKRGKTVKANPGVLLAPMPGKIIKVVAEDGQAVAEGDVVLVMEAMKMEYTLKADIAGEVKIKTATNDQVALGEELAIIEGEKSG